MPVTVLPDQEAALLRVATYHRRDFDWIVIRSPPHEHAPVLPFVAQPFPTRPISTLGRLGHFPSEILTAICLFLDIRSCFRFRQVNRATRVFVSGFLEYRHIAAHGLEALRALLRTGLAHSFTFGVLYRALYSRECRFCGSFGVYLFLPTIARCCVHCLEHSPETALVPLTPLSRVSGVSRERLRRFLPVFYTVPGRYTMEESARKRRLHLVVESAAYDALESFHTGPARPANLLEVIIRFSRSPDRERVVQRYMAATAFPSLDRASGQVENGISCKGCQIALEANGANDVYYDRRERVYSSKGFLDHFQSCAEAQRLWVDSCWGTRAFDEPEFTKRGGVLNAIDTLERPR